MAARSTKTTVVAASRPCTTTTGTGNCDSAVAVDVEVPRWRTCGSQRENIVNPSTATTAISTNVGQARLSLSAATYTIHSTRPTAARRKCPRISAGGKRLRLAPTRRWPPLANHMPSRTKPPTAVMTQAMSAAMSMRPPSSSSAICVGLRGFVRHADAIAVRQPPAQPAGHGEQDEGDDRQRHEADRGAIGVVEAAVAQREADGEQGDHAEVDSHVDESGREGAGAGRDGEQVEQAEQGGHQRTDDPDGDEPPCPLGEDRRVVAGVGDHVE